MVCGIRKKKTIDGVPLFAADGSASAFFFTHEAAQ